jgi:hypothetical protein
MPKPQGTYIQIRRAGRASHAADESRKTTAVARQDRLRTFHEALARASERQLDADARFMAALVDDLKKGEPTAKSDKTRKKVAEVLESLRGMLERAEDYKQLEGRLQAPVYPVMAAPADLGVEGAGLALAIAICQILEALVRIRKAGKKDPAG